MSTSILYHGFGICGYRYSRTFLASHFPFEVLSGWDESCVFATFGYLHRAGWVIMAVIMAQIDQNGSTIPYVGQ